MTAQTNQPDKGHASPSKVRTSYVLAARRMCMRDRVRKED